AFPGSIRRKRASRTAGFTFPGVRATRSLRSTTGSRPRPHRRSTGESYQKWIPSSLNALAAGMGNGNAARSPAAAPITVAKITTTLTVAAETVGIVGAKISKTKSRTVAATRIERRTATRLGAAGTVGPHVTQGPVWSDAASVLW